MAYTPASTWHSTTTDINDGQDVNQLITRPPSRDVADNIKWLRDHVPLMYDDTSSACDDSVLVENDKLIVSDYTPGLLKGFKKKSFGPSTAGTACTVISNHSRLFVCEEALLYCHPLNTAAGGGGYVVHTDTHTYPSSGVGSGHMAVNHNKLAVMSTNFTTETIQIIDVSAGDLGSSVSITMAGGTFVGMAMCSDRLYVLTDEGATYKLRAYDMTGTLVDDIVLTADTAPKMCATNGEYVVVMSYDSGGDQTDLYFYDRDASTGLGSRTNISVGECNNLVVSGPWIFALTDGAFGCDIIAVQAFWGADGDEVAHVSVGTLTKAAAPPASESFNGSVYPGFMVCDGRFLYVVCEGAQHYAAYRLDSVGAGDLVFDHEGRLPSAISASTISNIYADGACLYVGLVTDGAETVPVAYSFELCTANRFVRAGSTYTTSPTGVWGFLQPVY